jgi:hypothetical protein
VTLMVSSDTMHHLLLGSPGRRDGADKELSPEHTRPREGADQEQGGRDRRPTLQDVAEGMRKPVAPAPADDNSNEPPSGRGKRSSAALQPAPADLTGSWAPADQPPMSVRALVRQPGGALPAPGEAEGAGSPRDRDRDRDGGHTHNPWKDIYLAQFSGLQAYGETGMTRLEELIEAALKSCDVARKTCPDIAQYFGAALMTQAGRVYSGCSLENESNPLLSVSAERTSVLKALSEGASALCPSGRPACRAH